MLAIIRKRILLNVSRCDLLAGHVAWLELEVFQIESAD